MYGKLFIVATPIGNLEDITYRALETLRSVDFVLCEDTRVTKKLLDHYTISTPTKTYHHHSGDAVMREMGNLLGDGNNLALVSDAGTPGISDPGNLLIEYLQTNYPEVEIVPIGGISAVTTALSVSGFATDKFIFLGFIPQKNKRKQFFEEIHEAKYTVAFFESSHRIEKTIKEMQEYLEKDRKVCICRELTKKFESIYRGTIADLATLKINTKGEFVILIKK